MSFEWGILFLGTIAAASFFSYRSGYKEGAEFGMETIIHNLAEKGIIDLDE